jgi:hypothetical protein
VCLPAARCVAALRSGGAQVPIVRIDTQGRPPVRRQLTPLQSGAVWVDDVWPALQYGLALVLNDMRPQGFMGRTFAAAHPDLKLSANPMQWTDDEVLRAMALYGDDLPGNLVGGV